MKIEEKKNSLLTYVYVDLNWIYMSSQLQVNICLITHVINSKHWFRLKLKKNRKKIKKEVSLCIQFVVDMFI